ncbi:MAG: hypothetical protein A3I89_02685 [Candidatus Harrisonbacteria bacterium RIFCSPLOWO2_02_FULL_41_11]|uniref:TrpR like protein, YerC/YecD n=1 Tax=Candidatus Harrisonbacteria bacterium RIFCSPHIGHO2_02_FULL_42_16 TaxID=1798404 RepID=A0A1G1ZL78_9BACT|nr:MAG: hypothetical protein A3B92_00395 [Candidatus Harrisonbacteria bacterium RIFCSPHIGHO2_02_FULL_42_16]OGY66566.1 MAG: hypothetical protein A3I89_02685 [Candidatus Harrisonbacteria bacterium RIFCSPLOWO2_02_FULL_41_11]
MAIIKNKKLNKALEKEIASELLKEFKKINSFNQAEEFLNKFMTSDEKILFIRRIAVIKLLEKKRKYRDIKELLGISSGTISKISDIIAGRGYGKNPNRKRKYSVFRQEKTFKPFRRKYKGATNIIDLL